MNFADLKYAKLKKNVYVSLRSLCGERNVFSVALFN